MDQGILIAIEGTDGAGKRTLTAKLVERASDPAVLRAARLTGVETISFPRYHTPTGQKVTAYLQGELGPAQQVDPYVAADLYAADRVAAAPEIVRWLDDGKLVLSDRYKISNEAHQGTKIDDPTARERFYRDSQRIEYEVNRIPRPDLTVVLHVPAAVSLARVEKRGNAKDGHENEDHTRKAERNYLELAALLPDHVVVRCVEGARELSPDEVADRVWEVVSAFLASR